MRKTIFSISIFIIGIITVQAKHDPNIPAILFVHGLAGAHTTWDKLVESLPAEYRYIGNYFFDQSKQVTFNRNPLEPDVIDGIFYPCFTLDFSNNQELTFHEQAQELKIIIDQIININGINKVILFGHSMGGVACRQYINDYGTEYIIGQVMVTAPNLGSGLGLLGFVPLYATEACQLGSVEESYSEECKQDAKEYTEKIEKLAGIKLSLTSKAIRSLIPGSYSLKDLNSVSYPENIPIVVVRSRLYNTPEIEDLATKNQINLVRIFTNDKLLLKHYNSFNIFQNTIRPLTEIGDGVVSYYSQDLANAVPNGRNLKITYFEIGSINNTFHTKTPKDIVVMHKALSTITKDYPLKNSPVQTDNVSIGFIIDSSGSMKENDPLNIRKEGVQQILDVVDQEDDFFIVDFDSRGRWLNSDNYTGWDKLRLRRSIQSIDSDGNTNIGSGLNTMKSALLNLNELSNTGVILLTDGKGEYDNQAEWFAQNNIPIYTISYRQMADSRLMNEIAEVTGGFYTQADDEEDVVSAFLAFYAKLKNNNRFISVKGSLNNCIPESNQFYVDPDTREMTITVNWQNNPLNVSLIQPNGIRITENHPDIQLNIGRNYKILKIDRPVSGKWNIEVTCNGASGTQPYLVEASGNSPLKIELNGGQSGNGIIQFNLVESDGLIDLTQINATVSLETPNNQIFDISDKFKNEALSYFPIQGGGNYKFTINITGIDVKGQHFSRVYQRTVNTGSFVPSYISSVSKKNGNFINATMGTLSGNRYGMKCFIYNQGGSTADPIAVGYVINLTQNSCTIELNDIKKTIPILPGCIVQLDVERWMNDY